jgi:pimeloyl-ACP methyl ester carboxylesterase
VQPRKLIFLPGAGGQAGFWEPVAQRLVHPARRVLLGWPGFGGNPPDAAVTGLRDLVARVVDAMDGEPCALIAQSMGGVIAVQAAAAKPECVTHLVLTATSGGVDVSDLRIADWRPSFVAAHPGAPRWFTDYRGNERDTIASIAAPTLLLWGDADPISPPAVGRRLHELLACSRMHVVPGGGHDLATTHADRAAPLIDAHLMR